MKSEKMKQNENRNKMKQNENRNKMKYDIINFTSWAAASWD